MLRQNLVNFVEHGQKKKTKLCGVIEVAEGVTSFQRSVNNVELINVSYIGDDTPFLMNEI